jgi:GTP pyrophosphokinase
MVRAAQLGVVAERSEDNVRRWIEKFRTVLKDMEFHQKEGDYIENVVTTFYNDDILVFTPNGMPVNLPKKATALDFAFEIHSHIGEHAHYARVNGQLASVKTELHRGDIVEIVTNPDIHPKQDWTDHVLTYKAKGFLKRHFAKREKPTYHFCSHCQPIPGEEVVGFKEADGTISVHKRNCPIAIGLASQQGDSIVSVDYNETQDALYPVAILILAIDRFHLLSDMINCITNDLHLSMESISTTTTDCIVHCTIRFGVHSIVELQTIIAHISAIKGVEEVKKL